MDVPRQEASFCRRATIFAIVAVIVLLPLGAWLLYRSVIESISNTYLLDQVADMVILHTNRANGLPPSNWEDLHPAYETFRNYTGLSFHEVKQSVDIDFKKLREIPEEGSSERPLYIGLSGRSDKDATEPEIEANKKIQRVLSKLGED